MTRTATRLAILLACLFAGGLVAARDDDAAGDEPPAFPWVELPDGAAARAWAGVGPEVRPADWQREFPAARLAAGRAWQDAQTWRDWSAWLAGAANEPDDEEWRAGLALLALEHGRTDGAWHHFAGAASSPEWLARLMPSFLPGVPADASLESAGRPADLADAVLLTPRIPPAEPLPSGALPPRKATVRDLSANGVRFDMRITFDSYGVQLDFEYKSGGHANLLVRIPQPDGFDIRVEYVDWIRQESRGEPLLVELSADEPQHTLFGRILAHEALWPSAGDGASPRELTEGGLWIEHEPEDPELELLTAVAESIEAALSIPTRLTPRRDERGTPPSDGATGLVVHLPAPGAVRERKLAWLAASVERHLLRP